MKFEGLVDDAEEKEFLDELIELCGKHNEKVGIPRIFFIIGSFLGMSCLFLAPSKKEAMDLLSESINVGFETTSYHLENEKIETKKFREKNKEEI